MTVASNLYFCFGSAYVCAALMTRGFGAWPGAVTDLFRPQRAVFFSALSFGTACSASGSTCTLASDCAEDPASVRWGGEWR
jgi:hypothetical protein